MVVEVPVLDYSLQEVDNFWYVHFLTIVCREYARMDVFDEVINC